MSVSVGVFGATGYTGQELVRLLSAHPQAEVYTRPELRMLAGRYYSAEDVGALESQPPFGLGRR
jgi:N-acetyl-gamma-glutamylphosphate reductase